MDGEIEATIFLNTSGEWATSTIRASSSGVMCISSYSVRWDSAAIISRFMSNRVDFAGCPFCTDRRMPFRMTLSPGETLPAASSSRYPVRRSGCAPPRSPSGLSWTSTFWVSTNRDSSVSSLNLVEPALRPHPSCSL